MFTWRIYLVGCILSSLLPLWISSSTVTASKVAFPGWPAHFDAQPLTQLPLTERERYFASGFPGRIGRFSDGKREWILRWVTRPTRKLHPSAQCMKAVGYAVVPAPIHLDLKGRQWGHYRASGHGQPLRLYERIIDTSNGEWTDVSQWFWAALLGKTSGPWWAITIAEQDSDRTDGGE